MFEAYTDFMSIQITICEHGSEAEKRRAIVTKLIELAHGLESGELSLEGSANRFDAGRMSNAAGSLNYAVVPTTVCQRHARAVVQGSCPECRQEFAGIFEVQPALIR